MAIPPGVNGTLHQWKKGDALKAEYWQGMTDAIERLSQISRGSGMTVTANGAGVFYSADPYNDGELFSNQSGGTIPAYGICLCGSGVVTNGANALPQAIQPNVYGCRQNFFINGPEPVTAGAPGLAQRGPRYLIAYDSADGTPIGEDRWGPRNGTYLLKKNTGGFRVLGIWDSGNHILIAESEPMWTVRGTIASDLAPDANGTLTVVTGAFGSEVSTGQTIPNVYNKSDCTVKSGSTKYHTAIYVPDNQSWQFMDARTA